MSKKVRKAVIPAAGLGTRMLPISRCVPKEMLPIVDRPAISYLVSEAFDSGITDVLIITGREKDAMEDYFDYSPEYDAALTAKGRAGEVEALHAEVSRGNVFFLRQKEKKGLGHAILQARSFVGDEPFAVLYGDDIIFAETPVTAQLIGSYARYGRPVAGLKHVPPEDLRKFCSMKAEAIPGAEREEYFVSDMIEKPAPGREYTDLAILGRVLLTPEIFGILENTAPGAGGEIQLTDAMAEYARRRGMTGLVFEGERFDLGSKLGLLAANVAQGVRHPEVGEAFSAFLREFVKTL
ncbi:MAG: UTP--glucose-1-phosphate uridylyltransferase [Clostridia bacterium]|nr:UTP--glucose-1-phosphate uridylyltransferase [Clostridia bacterium]